MAGVSPGFAAKMARLHGAKIASSNPGAASGAGKVKMNTPGKPAMESGPHGNAASRLASLLRLKAAMRTGSAMNGGDGGRDKLAYGSTSGGNMGGKTPQPDESAF